MAVFALIAAGARTASATPAAALFDHCTRMGIPAPAIGIRAVNVKGRWNHTAVGPDGPLSITLQCGGESRGSLTLGASTTTTVRGRVVGTATPATVEFTGYHPPSFERFHEGVIERGFLGPIVLRQMRGVCAEWHSNGTTLCCFDWRATRRD